MSAQDEIIRDMTADELAEEIARNTWMLTSADVEMSDAQRAFVQADQDRLTAEAARRTVPDGTVVAFTEGSGPFEANAGIAWVTEGEARLDNDHAQRTGEAPKPYVLMTRAADMHKAPARRRTRLAYIADLTVLS